MNKTATTEYQRLFLVETLPEPLTPASSHLQIFDNYVENTRLRLRLMREPHTKIWTRILQQRFAFHDGDAAVTKLAEIYLNEDEYPIFERLRGREIRKNRYFHEFDRTQWAFDVYLGEVRGVTTGKVEFDSAEALKNFEPPPFALIEITDEEFFEGRNLVEKNFVEIREEVARLGRKTGFPPSREVTKKRGEG
jgi:CYTH domain-containing protein